MQTLDELNADVAGVSGCDTDQRLDEYRDKLQLPFFLVSDCDRAIARAYGVARKGGLPVRRTTFVVRSGGTIGAVFHHEVRLDLHLKNALRYLRTPR